MHALQYYIYDPASFSIILMHGDKIPNFANTLTTIDAENGILVAGFHVANGKKRAQ